MRAGRGGGDSGETMNGENSVKCKRNLGVCVCVRLGDVCVCVCVHGEGEGCR